MWSRGSAADIIRLLDCFRGNHPIGTDAGVDETPFLTTKERCCTLDDTHYDITSGRRAKLNHFRGVNMAVRFWSSRYITPLFFHLRRKKISLRWSDSFFTFPFPIFQSEVLKSVTVTGCRRYRAKNESSESEVNEWKGFFLLRWVDMLPLWWDVCLQLRSRRTGHTWSSFWSESNEFVNLECFPPHASRHLMILCHNIFHLY